jgi:hypothetical protein
MYGDVFVNVEDMKTDRRLAENGEQKMDARVITKLVRLPVTHFKNSRTHRTICGKNYRVPKRKVTYRLSKVTCKGCLNSIRSLKWVKKMVERRNRTYKSPQEIIYAILSKVEK